MTIKTSEDVYKFVKDCIKIKEEVENAKIVKKKEKNRNESKNNLSKYNFDYSKFESCIKEIEEEEEEKKKIEKNKHHFINDRNPCTHDHSKERQLYEKDSKEKIKASNAFNEEGKKAFYEKNFKLACVYFRKGLIQLDYSFPDLEQEKCEQKKLEINLHLNMALTKFHMSKYYECISECSTVLNFDQNNIKAYYRKGQAYMKLDLYNEAKQEFLKVLEIDPSNNNAKRSLLDLKEKILIYNKKNKLVCSKFFSFNENKTKNEKKKANIQSNLNESNYENVNEKINNKNLLTDKDNIKEMDKNNNFDKNLINKIKDKKSYLCKVKKYIFMINSTSCFKNYYEFLMNNVLLCIFICFSIFSLIFTFVFTSYKNFLTCISFFPILSFIGFFFIYVLKKK
ncbi:peptidyl-prolyl cis-trans isomerase, putative [Plasmodium gallinaceum]|uniref:Peptidyl-prolyl cis-trans isomerase, putative n=1 Tax=Plasmodium gallinaceum TaxID=5849 RepID=A0A1J1GUG1_PLAGA|nr:peptidyl-prolyl cis-trans isomerase, putative [Plasmodium gallinaceum]CRG96169.1 peptidyl-prolyl cis-trans isomerase, putative [Plasmodium gallinaceum]